MTIIALVVLVALLIPILVVAMDSPLGRALARRVEGPQAAPPELLELARKVELLESEVDDLNRIVQNLQDDNAFLQRLLEEAPQRPTLPPPAAS